MTARDLKQGHESSSHQGENLIGDLRQGCLNESSTAQPEGSQTQSNTEDPRQNVKALSAGE